MRRAVACLIVVAAVAGCASPPQAPARTPAPPRIPAPDDGMAWELTPDTGDGETKLAFGAPDSETVVVMLTCRPKSGQVAVTTLEREAPASPMVVLTSQTARSRLPARAEPSALSDGVLVEATASAADPVLADFTRTGALGLEVDGRLRAVPAADPAQARRFLESCQP